MFGGIVARKEIRAVRALVLTSFKHLRLDDLVLETRAAASELLAGRTSVQGSATWLAFLGVLHRPARRCLEVRALEASRSVEPVGV